MLNKDSFIKFV